MKNTMKHNSILSMWNLHLAQCREFNNLIYGCFLVALLSWLHSIFKPLILQDVAVKVLTVQDFQDDQLKEFLREVCTFKPRWRELSKVPSHCHHHSSHHASFVYCLGLCACLCPLSHYICISCSVFVSSSLFVVICLYASFLSLSLYRSCFLHSVSLFGSFGPELYYLEGSILMDIKRKTVGLFLAMLTYLRQLGLLAIYSHAT